MLSRKSWTEGYYITRVKTSWTYGIVKKHKRWNFHFNLFHIIKRYTASSSVSKFSPETTTICPRSIVQFLEQNLNFLVCLQNSRFFWQYTSKSSSPDCICLSKDLAKRGKLPTENIPVGFALYVSRCSTDLR